METAIFTRESGDVWIVFIVMELVFITLWTIIYLALRKPPYRRPEYLQLWNEPCSRNCSLVFSTAIALPLIIYMYIDCWQYYYSISRESNRLNMHYQFPSRTKTVGIDDLKITTEVEVRKGAQYRIKGSSDFVVGGINL
jgi:hypothetical protein